MPLNTRHIQAGRRIPVVDTIAGVADEFVLSGTPLSANQDYYGSLNWVEVF